MERQAPSAGDSRRADLVRAAYGLIAREGFEGLRTRDIASAVGVNVATLHYYFPTKEALIRAVVGHAMQRFRQTLETEGSARSRLRRHFQGLRRLAREEPELFAVMGEVALRARRDPAIAKILGKTDDMWHETLAALLQSAAKEGDATLSSTPASAAALAIATLKGVFMIPADARDAKRVEQTLAQLERALGV